MRAKYDRNGAFLGYELTGQTVARVDGSPEQIAAYRERITGAFEAPSESMSEAWLVELSMIAPRRNDGEGNAELLLSAYSSRLGNYPADVAREALLGRTWRFFPSWFELHEVCEELASQRRAVHAAVERAIAEREERELRARALPPEWCAVPTADEHHENRAKRSQVLGDLIAELSAKAKAQEADRLAAQEAAVASYRKPGLPE